MELRIGKKIHQFKLIFLLFQNSGLRRQLEDQALNYKDLERLKTELENKAETQTKSAKDWENQIENFREELTSVKIQLKISGDEIGEKDAEIKRFVDR